MSAPFSSLSPAPARALAEPGLHDIRALVMNDLPALPEIAGGDALGDFAPLWRWLKAARHGARPPIRHPRIALFAASCGAGDAPMDRALRELREGRHPVSKPAAEANADLQVYELGRAETRAPLEAAEACRAMAYGMMAVQPGVDLLLCASLAPASADAGADITLALAAGAEPVDSLLRCGSTAIAAMTGALIAARLARIPVLLDGTPAAAAGALLEALSPGAAAHAREPSRLLGRKTALPPPCDGVLLIPLLKALGSCEAA